jgi:hypothetical protein
MQDFSRDAFGFANVLAGFADGEAVGGEGGCGEERERCDSF